MSEKYGYRKSSTVSPLMMRFVRFGRSTSPGPLRKAFGSVASILAALHIPNTTTTTSAVAHDDREKVEAFVIVLVFFSLLVSIFYPTVMVWQKMVMVWRKMMVGDNRQQGARQK